MDAVGGGVALVHGDEYCRPEQATTDQYGTETSEWLNLS
jgi:hypothetical protein